MDSEPTGSEKDEVAALLDTVRQLVDSQEHVEIEASFNQREFYAETHKFLMTELLDRLGEPTQAGLAIAAAHATKELFEALQALDSDAYSPASALNRAATYLYNLYPSTDQVVIDCICTEAIARQLPENT